MARLFGLWARALHCRCQQYESVVCVCDWVRGQAAKQKARVKAEEEAKVKAQKEEEQARRVAARKAKDEEEAALRVAARKIKDEEEKALRVAARKAQQQQEQARRVAARKVKDEEEAALRKTKAAQAKVGTIDTRMPRREVVGLLKAWVLMRKGSGC